MNRIRSISRFACLLAELALAGRNLLTKAAKSRARHRIALAVAIVGPVAPLAAGLPATAASAEGRAPPDMVTQWNLTLIAGLEAAAIPPPPAARIGAIVQASVFDAVQRGLAWGRTVATDILTWRATDGFGAPPPPYVVGSAPGDWQPTPPTFLASPQAPLFRQFATMTPFALTSPAQFLPSGPPPLTGARYARDLAEVQAFGSATSTTRTAEQT